MNNSDFNSVPTTVCSEKVMEVLEELLDFNWTRAVLLLLLLSEAQQHIDLKKGHI